MSRKVSSRWSSPAVFVLAENERDNRVGTESGTQLILKRIEMIGLMRKAIQTVYDVELESADLIPPYVVHAELPYADFGDGDQDTPVYRWAVRVDADHVVLERIEKAVDAELQLTTAFADELCDVPPVPEMTFNVPKLDGVTSVAEALVDLRTAMLDHATANLTTDQKYWQAFGIDPGFVSFLSQPLVDVDGPLADRVTTAFAVHFKHGIHANQAQYYARLRAWAKGDEADAVQRVQA